MQCSHPLCWYHLSGPIICWGLDLPLCDSWAILGSIAGSVAALLHLSFVLHISLIPVLVSCMGSIYVWWNQVPSVQFCLEGWLCWGHLQVQPTYLECTWFQNHMVVFWVVISVVLGVHLINSLNGFFLKADGLTCIQTFCIISNGGILNTQTLPQAFLFQCWYTSFLLESELLMHMPLAYHLVAILHQDLLEMHLTTIQPL